MRYARLEQLSRLRTFVIKLLILVTIACRYASSVQVITPTVVILQTRGLRHFLENMKQMNREWGLVEHDVWKRGQPAATLARPLTFSLITFMSGARVCRKRLSRRSLARLRLTTSSTAMNI